MTLSPIIIHNDIKITKFIHQTHIESFEIKAKSIKKINSIIIKRQKNKINFKMVSLT